MQILTQGEKPSFKHFIFDGYVLRQARLPKTKTTILIEFCVPCQKIANRILVEEEEGEDCNVSQTLIDYRDRSEKRCKCGAKLILKVSIICPETSKTVSKHAGLD